MSDFTSIINEVHEDDAPVEIADKPREPTPYEKKLRTEARQHRIRAAEAEKARDAAISAAQKAADDKIAAAQAQANERVVRAELKVHAIKAGMVDVADLKLLDLASIKMNEVGEVEGADALIGQLKNSKPYLFTTGSSSSLAKPPAEQTPVTKKAMEMTPEEWRIARAAMLKRR